MSAREEGLLGRALLSPTAEAGPEWLLGLRRDATAHLREAGFPGKKHEKWRFTSVRDVVATPFDAAPASRSQAEVDAARAYVDSTLGDDGTLRIVLLDGRPSLDSDTFQAGLPAGVRVLSLSDVLQREPALVQPVLGKLAPSEHFAALNGALFEDGAVVVIERGAHVETPIHIVHVASTSGGPTAAYPRLVVLAGDGSQATLVESYLCAPGTADRDATHLTNAAHLTNAVGEVSVGANARLDHVRITEGTSRARQIAYLAVRLDRDAFYGSRVVSLGGTLTRLELSVRFDGPGSEADLDGVYHVGEGEHVDHQLLVRHAAGRCTSHVRYRGLLDGNGHAVFGVASLVEKDAQQSSAHQENRNLLLSPNATIDTKPHLEIEADDISASHGAAVGAMDMAQLFYLRARGIPEAEAKDILTFAFVRALLDRIPHAPLVTRTSDAVRARLPEGLGRAAGAEELER